MGGLFGPEAAGRPPAYRPEKPTERKGGALPIKALDTSSSFFRLRGEPPTASLQARLAELRGPELAFVLAGVAILLTVPLAERWINGAPPEDPFLESGFDAGSVPFAGAVEEGGVRRLAAGGPPGQDGRVVRPLSAPDPLTMIMPGSKAPAPAASKPGLQGRPARRRPEKKTNWKEALSSAAKRATADATNAASVPRPHPKLAGKLKGLAALSSSGGSTSAGVAAPKLEAPRSDGLTGTLQRSSSLTPVMPTQDFRASGERSLSAGGDEAPLPRGELFDGRAQGSDRREFLLAAERPSASETTSTDNDKTREDEPEKAPPANTAKDQKQIGESLAQQRAKMEMQKAMDLKWAKKEYAELGRRKMMDQIRAQTQAQLLLKMVDIAGQLANTFLQGVLQGQQQQQ